jgi:hypothetical protein
MPCCAHEKARGPWHVGPDIFRAGRLPREKTGRQHCPGAGESSHLGGRDDASCSSQSSGTARRLVTPNDRALRGRSNRCASSPPTRSSSARRSRWRFFWPFARPPFMGQPTRARSSTRQPSRWFSLPVWPLICERSGIVSNDLAGKMRQVRGCAMRAPRARR